MEAYEKLWIDGRLRLQFELIVEPEIRKVLTLEHMLTVFRRTLRPERITRQETEEVVLSSEQFFAGRGGETDYQAYQGAWRKDGKGANYYLDDATENNEDGTITAGILWWELEEEDETIEQWFREVVQAMLEAEDNLLLFGRI